MTNFSSPTRKVLVLRLSSLGDVILTAPVYGALKARWPDCSISVLVKPQFAAVLEGGPDVDRIIPFHGLGQALSLIRAERFTHLLDLHGNLRSIIIRNLSGIPNVAVYRKDGMARRLFVALHRPSPRLALHTVERYMQALGAWGLPRRIDPDQARFLAAAPAQRADIDARLQEAGISPSQALVGVHPGAVWPTKRWLPERFAELCRRFEREGLRVVLVGGKEDAALCAQLAAGSGALDWSGRSDLRGLKALVGRLRLFITNDSGPMHLAAACGVPTLAIFGPTTREFGFFPCGREHRVVEAELACRPCSLHGTTACPAGHFLCMKLISVDEVWKNAREMLHAARLII